MLSIISNTKDIYFHLAVEEFLLKNRAEEFFMLWQSEPCVVVGKHQNALAEVHHRYLRAHHIPVARRLTGGGTVYHGPGNMNFTFIRNGEQGKLVDFKKFVRPVVKFLQLKGLPATIGTRNDLLIEGLKISGNAEHVFKQRVLHHGTLLFNADLEVLNTSIRVRPGRFRDKAVQSNRSEVTNIAAWLIRPQTIDEFSDELYQFLVNEFSGSPYQFTRSELKEIELLKATKYHCEVKISPRG